MGGDHGRFLSCRGKGAEQPPAIRCAMPFGSGGTGAASGPQTVMDLYDRC